jgi:arginase
MAIDARNVSRLNMPQWRGGDRPNYRIGGAERAAGSGAASTRQSSARMAISAAPEAAELHRAPRGQDGPPADGT